MNDTKLAQCNIRDITARKLASVELKALHGELEQRVRDRTVQLNSLNSDLESFNYSVFECAAQPPAGGPERNRTSHCR